MKKEEVLKNVERVYESLEDIIKEFKTGYIFMNKPLKIVEESEKPKETKTSLQQL